MAAVTGTTSSSSSPRRFIYNDDDLEHFLASPSKSALLKLTAAMGKSCAAQSSKFQYDPQQPLTGLSPATACLHGTLGAILDWVDSDFPASGKQSSTQSNRFGNPIFREWHHRLTERSVSIVATIIQTSINDPHPESHDYDMEILLEANEAGKQAAATSGSVALESLAESNRSAVQELACYLQDSFGHPVRLDYGTGHETSFQIFLFALCKLHCFGSTETTPPSQDRLKAVTLSMYHQYLSVTRKLQTDYMLEPAGSHGVWGLDDYHCLPFYFGACQLQNQEEEHFTPRAIHDESVLRENCDTYLYFGCIRFIKSLKRGVPFFESSPMLNDISQLPTWSKVASGLLKLYEGEVLSKRQVVQHLVFGEIFCANWTPSQQEPHAAPTENFRTVPTTEGRAPWADAPTRAPWAK